MGMWRSLHPFHTTSSPSRRSTLGRRRSSRSERQRRARRVRSLERFEERFMLNAGPELISILANNGDVVYAPYTAGQTPSLHTAPRELDLLFNQGTNIDPTTLGGVQVVSAGADGKLNTADDVPIEPGFVGMGNLPNEIVLRFDQSLPDDLYQVTLVGKGPQALTDTNSPADPFNSGNPAQPNLQVAFKVDAGPQVLSVVPEPVRFNPATGLLQQANNEIDVYFDKAIQSLPQQFGQLDPQLFQLIYTANTPTTADDISFNPSSVSFDASTNKATLIFSTPLEAIGSGAFRLRIGDDQNVSGDRGLMTPTVVSVPEPAGGTFSTAATIPYNNGKLDQNQLQDNQVIVSSQLGSDSIDPGLAFPGGNSGPGVRNVPAQQHINLGTAALPPPTPGVIPTITYNFPDVYGSTQGTGPLHNVITSAEESLTREIFQLYSYYLGVQFREVSSTALGAANLGIVTGVTQAVSPNAPASLPAATGQSTFGNQQGYLAVMNASTFNNQATPYGGAWFQSAMQQIGRLLGLGDDAEGPPGTIMGLGLNDPATGQPAEPVFPGNADILHGQYLYRPLSDNVDLYSFTVSTPGQFSAETIAQRLVSSVISLPQTGSAPVGSAVVDGSTFTVNDGVHAPLTFEFAADGRAVTDGNVVIAYHSSDAASQVAADVAAAINGATTAGSLSTNATVNVNQVVLSGLPKLTASGNQGQVTYGQQPSQLNSVITLFNQTNVIQVTDAGVTASGQPNGVGTGLYGSTFTLSDGVHPAVTFQYAKPWEVDIAAGATGGSVAGGTISVVQGNTTKTFEFTTGTLANGDPNVPIVVSANDGPAALAAKAAQAINGGSGFSAPGLATATSSGAILIGLATTDQLVQVSGAGLSLQGPGNTQGFVPVEFAPTATAHDVAVAISNAVNSNATTSGLNATATVQFEQVVLGGPLTVTSSGAVGRVTYSVQHQIISRNDDYFGNDSFVRMDLTPGMYYVSVTSTGNTQFDPNVAGSGYGGTTQGPYDLKLDFTPASQALKTLTDTDGNALHGNSNGTSGGAYDFWFNVGSTIFVDKAPPPNSAASGQPLGSVSNPYTNLGQALKVAANRIVAPAGTATLAGQTFVINDGVNTPVTFEFVQSNQSLPAGDFNVPVKYNVGDSAAAVAEAIVAAIQSSPKPLFVTPTYYDSDSEFEPAGSETSTSDPDQDEYIIDLQVPAQGTAFVDLKGAPALLAGARIVRVLGTAGADNNIGVPLDATVAMGGPSGSSTQITPTSTNRGSDAFQVTAGSFSETFEFTTNSSAIKNGLLADGNLAVLVAPGASSRTIALAMAQAINSSPLSQVTGGTVSATVATSASASPNGEAWWITLAGVGTLTINTQSTPALLSVSNAAPYEIGTSQFGGALADGSDLTVPQGVTVMIDAGAVFKLEGANISVGESSPGVDYSESALQVLGTPSSSVFFTSFHDNSVGTLTDTVTSPTAGDWGGIVFGPGADLESQGVFLDTVNNARLTYGGGAVSVNGVLTPFTPIYLDGSRPSITHNTILQSHNSAISADPNSFNETIFGGPAYDPTTGASLPVSQAYISDYERAGPDIEGNTLSLVQSGPQTINAVAGNQIVQGETFVVYNPSNASAPAATFEFVNSEALLPGSTLPAGTVLPDGNYAVLFSPGEPANGSIPAVPPDTAAQVAAQIAAAINAAKIGVTATVPATPANSSQVLISGVSQVAPSSPTSFTAPDSSLIVDGETFVVRNLTTGATATFEFNSTASVAAGHVRVAYTVGDSSATVAGAMAAAINGVGNLGVLAVLNGSQVVLSGAVDFQFGTAAGLNANPRVLTTSAGSALVDGTTFQITNSLTGAVTTFQYRLDTDTPPTTPSANIIIQYSLSDQDTDVANETAAAINAANLGVSAVVSANQVSLIETPSGQFVSPISMQSMVIGNTVNGLFIRTQNATTQLPESLSVSARWTATDIPYVLSDNLVIAGNPGGALDGTPRLSGRLDIDPGVTVKLGGSHIETQMGANFIAEGTASNPIVFTSLHDDSYGGGGTFDTDGNNSNPAPTLPQAGDWSGLYFAPTSHGSLDHTLIAYGGGGSTVQGNSDNFNAVEIHQATVRIADSTLENNAAGLASDTRAGLEGNDSATIFVLGAQPAIVNNVFQNNRGATISINANSLTSTILPDPGRSTGAIGRFTQFDANRGPLVRLNQIGNTLGTPGVINGMLVRGGTLDTSSVWDDTDIVHVVKQQIQVPNVDSRGGLMLQSSANASLVVKFGAASAGLTATGTPLDISDRIGGSVQIVGTPSHPVVLTALGDETVGAGLTPQGQPQKATDNGLGLVQTGQALLPTVPEVNRGTTIDNDVATNVVGHFEAKIGPGGDMGTDTGFLTGITAQGQTQLLLNQNFVFDFANYVDVGSTGAATRLSATTIDQAPTRVAPDVVVSKGHFTGKNSTVNWTVTSSFKPGTTQLVNQVAFDSSSALGDLRFINYLDEDVPPIPNDDLLYTQGTPGQPGFQVFTIDGPQRVGVSQGGVYQPGPQLVNATYDGWAADSFDNLQQTIAANGGTFTVAGNINTTNLPPGTDPQLGQIYGPADQTTAFAWNVDPNATSSLITTFLSEVSGPATPPGGQWKGITLDQYSNDRNVAVVNETESANTGGAGTNDTPATSQSLGQLAPNLKSGDDTQRLGFVVNGVISTPSDADVYTFKAQPGTQVWMDLGNTSPGLDSIVELVDANGTVLARSDNALAESNNPSLLYSSASGSAGFAGNLAMPVNAGTLLQGNYDPTNPSLSNTVYDPASQTNPGLRNLMSTNPLDAGFRVVLPGNPNSPTPQDYYVRVRSRGPNLTDLHGGQSSGAYQLQIRLQEQQEFPGSTVQYADIRFAKNGVDVVGLPAHSPLLGETGQAGSAQNTDAATPPANQPDPRPTAQDLGNPLTSDRAAVSVAGNLATPTTVTWYKFELNYDFLNAIQGVNAGQKTWSTIFDVDYADGLSRPNTTISVFDSTGKLIYIGRDSNIADDQPTPNSANGLTDLTHGSAGQLDPYIGSVQLPAGAYSFIDISPAAIDTNIPGNLISVTFNGVTQTFEFTAGTLPQGDTNVPITVAAGDTAAILASKAAQTIDTAFNNPNFVTLNGLRLSFPNGSVADTSGPLVTTSNTYYVAISSDATLPQALDATFNGGSANTLVRLEPVDSVNRIVEDHIGSQGGQTAQPAGTLTPMFNGSVDTTNFNPNKPTQAQLQQIQSLNASAVPFTLGDIVLFVDQKQSANGVPGHLQTVNPYTGGLVTDIGPTPGSVNGSTGYDDIAMRNDGRLYGITLGPGGGAVGNYDQIDTGTAQATNIGNDNVQPAPNLPVEIHALAFLQNGLNRQLFAVGSLSSAGGGVPSFQNGFYQLDPNTGNSLNNPQQTPVLLNPTGVSGNETITGMAAVGGTLYAVTDAGGLYIISNPGGQASLVFVAPVKDANGNAIRFTALTAGPPDVSGGAYANDLFATDAQGKLYALSTSGTLLPIFAGGATSVSLGTTNVVGLAFSTLDYNLWHVTDQRGNDPGHGINAAPDNSRNAGSANQPQAGNLSFYFGMENPAAPGTIDVPGTATPQSLQPGAANYATNLDPNTGANAVYNTYNLPGGALGSLQTNSFSLANYTYGDKPTLYFNYFLATQNASSTTQNPGTMLDSARVFISADNGKTWQMLATNDSSRQQANVAQPDGELPSFASASSSAYPNGVVPQRIQQLYDTAGGTWRQARIDLGDFAGQSNLKLRFDFSSAGSMNQGLPGDSFGNFNSPARGQNNRNEGFYVDDITVGFAERGEMVTGNQANMAFVPTPQNPNTNAPTQILNGPYQLNIRRGTEYGVNVSPSTSDISLVHSYDTNDRLVDGFSILAPSGSALTDGQSFQISDGSHVVNFEFDQGDTLSVAGNVVNNDSFTINDGTNSKQFVFIVNGNPLNPPPKQPNQVQVFVKSTDSPAVVASDIANAVNSSGLVVRAVTNVDPAYTGTLAANQVRILATGNTVPQINLTGAPELRATIALHGGTPIAYAPGFTAAQVADAITNTINANTTLVGVRAGAVRNLIQGVLTTTGNRVDLFGATSVTAQNSVAGQLTVSAAAHAITETGSTSTTQVTVTRSNTASLSSPVTVQIQALDLIRYDQNPNTGAFTLGTGEPTNNLQLVNPATNQALQPGSPLTVLIPAGQSSVTFSVRAVDQTGPGGAELADGPVKVQIVATALGYTTGADTLDVNDDAQVTPALTLTLNDPASGAILENAGPGAAHATVTRNTPDNVPLTVTLTSLDPASAQVPATVTIPAGSFSATFAIDAIDDNILRSQAVNVTIVASAVNFVSGTTSVAVQDDGDVNQIPQNVTAWQSQGPSPIQFGQDANVTGSGGAQNPVAGAIESVLSNPTNPNILYVGTVNGGIWETTNATSSTGPTWKPLTDNMPSLSIGALQYDTTDVTYQHLIAGIGRFSSFANAGGQLSGLIVSSDGGQTWTPVTPIASSPANPVGQNISGVAQRGNIILAAGNYFFNNSGGLYRSTDNGATFNLISGQVGSGLPAGPISDLIGDPLDTKRFYAAVLTKGIFTSDDNGATWIDVTPAGLKAILNSQPQGDNIRIADSGASVYFGYEKFDPLIGGTQLAAIYYSPAANLSSTTWTAMDLPTTNENGTIVGLNPDIGGDDVPGAQGEIHFSIVADPNNPNLVYVGGDRQPDPFPNSIGATNYTGRLFRGDSSKPLGSQWTPITDNFTANQSAPHADSRHMTFDSTGRLIESDDGGVFTLSNPETSQGVWTSLNGNLSVTEIHSIAYDTVTNTLIAGDQDTGTPEQTSPGSTTWNEFTQGDGGDVAVDDSNPNQSIRYTSFPSLGGGPGGFMAATYDTKNNLVNLSAPALIVTNANNASIYAVDTGLPFVTTVKLNSLPGFSNHMVIGGGSAVYESFDGGQTLTELFRAGNPVGGVGPFQLFGAAMAYGGTSGGVADPSVLWIGANAQVFLRFGGFNSPITKTNYAGGNVRDLVINPNNWRNAIVVDATNHVWLTADGGASFTDISGNLTGGTSPLTSDLFSAAFVPGSSTNLIYVGARDGVYVMKSAQQGVWSRYGSFMPDVPVYSLQYVPSQQLLVAGTMGRGAFTASAIGASGDITATVNTQNVSDDGGVITGTVTRNGTFGNLAVTLASSDPALVPTTTVTIPDGQSSQAFSINVNDLLDANGNEVAIPRETVILTPLAGGLNSVATYVNVSEDNPTGLTTSDDLPALSVTLSANEMNPNLGVNAITGTVSRNTPTDQPLTVTLAVSDPTRATATQNGNTTVVIPAGSQSVNFTLSYVDQFANDGQPHWVTVTAAGITYQGLGITSDNGDGNDDEDPELADPTGASLDGDESFTIKVDAAQHLLSYDRRGDANINRDQGQVIIASSRISNSLDYGVVVEPGPRDVFGNLPHPGVPLNLSTINSSRIAPGATIENNLLANNGAGGIQFLGDSNATGPLAAVPFGRIINNTVYGGAQQTGTGVQVGQNASPTILNNIFANLATGVSVDNTSSSTHLEGSVYQNDGTTLNGSVFNGADLFSVSLSPTDPLFANAANGDFYLAPGSKAIDSAINSLSDRPDMISAKSLTGIPASFIYAPGRDLYGQLRVADPETNPSGVGSTLFKDRGAIERVDFVGPTAALANPIDNSLIDQDPTTNVVHEVGAALNNFAVQLNDGSGVGVDDSTVSDSKFSVYRDGVRLTSGIDYFFSYDTNTKTAYFTPATGTWATGHQYTIYVNNGSHFDLSNTAAATPQNAIKDLAGNPLQPNRGTGSPTAGFTQFDILLQNTGGDAPSVGVPGIQSTPENTPLAFGAANPITIFNIDAPGDTLTVTLATSQGTLSLDKNVANVTVSGNGTSNVVITGTAAAINAALSGVAAGQTSLTPLTFTPTQYFFGTATIQVAATDPATGLTGNGVATIGVTETNQAPLINVPPLQSVNENPSFALVFSAATGNAITITDPNGGNGPDQVTIAVPNGIVTLSGTSGLTFSQGSRVGSQMTFSGLLSDINAALNGMTFLPAHNFAGATSIQFSAAGQATGANPVGTGKALINVVAVNQPPAGSIPDVTASEVSQPTVIRVIDLNQYIVDPDVNNTPPEAPPTFVVTGNTNNSLLSATINGHLLTLTLNAYQFGSTSITISAIDGNPVGARPFSTTFNVTVSKVNFPAITTPSEYEYTPGQPLVITSPGVLSGDLDPNGNPLTAVLFQVPNHGKLVLNGDGSFSYVPDPGFNGRDSFIYKVDNGTGANNRTAATVYLDSPTSLWVARMYSEVLGRTTQPGDAEINYWVGQLNAGMTRTEVAQFFVTSPERRSHVIADLYETYLGRAVDPAGLSYWLGVWNANQGPEQVQAGIIGSQEFFQTAGGTPQAWVTALYQNLFERNPGPSEVAYWVGVIQTQSRASVVLGFVTSDEYRLNLLRGIPNDPDDPDGPNDPNEPNDSGWYVQYLHRPIDQSGALYWLNQMKAGYPQEAILEGILGSDEYFNRA